LQFCFYLIGYSFQIIACIEYHSSFSLRPSLLPTQEKQDT
jgi:hypothetical protein